MRRAAFLLAGLCACAAPPASASPSLAPTASATVVATASSAPTARVTPSPSPSSRLLTLTGDIAARAIPVPTEFRYVRGAEGAIGRVFLVDLARGTVNDVVAVRTEGTGTDFSASLDGRLLLVSGLGPTRHAALYLVDVSNGSARLLYEDVELQAPGALGGVLSATGARYAFATLHDVRIGETSGGPARLIAAHDDPNRVGGTWHPAGWSADGAWLALSRSDDATSEVAIVDTSTAAIRRLGTGTQVAWRARSPMRAPELVVSAGTSLFGGSTALYTYDIRTNRGTVLVNGGTLRVGSLAWHPTEDRFLYTAGPVGPPGDDVFFWRLGDPAATRVASSRKVVEAWWSSDGSKVYGLAIRQEALAATGVGNYEVIDVASGALIATVCGGDPRTICP
jgi:Tol biopolymer transport system component